MSLDKQRQVPEDLPQLRLALEGGLSNDYPICILLVESGLPDAIEIRMDLLDSGASTDKLP
jgi:hypothetical protein